MRSVAGCLGMMASLVSGHRCRRGGLHMVVRGTPRRTLCTLQQVGDRYERGNNAGPGPHGGKLGRSANRLD